MEFAIASRPHIPVKTDGLLGIGSLDVCNTTVPKVTCCLPQWGRLDQQSVGTNIIMIYFQLFN